MPSLAAPPAPYSAAATLVLAGAAAYLGFHHVTLAWTRQDARVHAWTAGLCGAYLVYCAGGLCTYAATSPADTVFGARLATGAALAQVACVVGLVRCLAGRAASGRVNAGLLAAGLGTVALSLATRLFFTGEVFPRVDALGQHPPRAAPGPLYPLLLLVAPSVVAWSGFTLLRSPRMDTYSRRIFIAAIAVYGMIGINDIAMTMNVIQSVRLFEIAFLGPVVAFDGIVVRRYHLLRTQLEEEVARRTVRLAEAVSHAEAATADRARFQAVMNHEMRTPLTAVIGLTGLLSGRQLPDGEQQDYVRTIHTNAEALLRLINDTLEHAQLEAGKLDTTTAAVDVRGAVDEAIDHVAVQAAERGIDLAFDVTADVPAHVVGDAGRVCQILANLLGNAVKFTADGGVSLEVMARAGEVAFAVRDTGMGISPDALATLFQPFAQAEGVAHAFGGTGLGLAVSRGLAARFGGRIDVESVEGEGSTFTLVLPATGAAPAAVGAPGELAGKVVWVIDGGVRSCAVAARWLEHAGAAVRRAATGAEALAWCSGGATCDAALVDVGIVLRENLDLRLRSALPTAAAVVLTTSLDWRMRAGEARAAELARLFPARVTKPLRADATLAAVADALRGATEPARAIAPAGAPAPATGPKRRVLVVDDQAMNRKVATRMLWALGHEAVEADGGLAALAALRGERFDAVLLDLNMPRLGGLETARQLLAEMPDPAARPRVIALTGSALAEERERCLAAGMDDYLTKPMRLFELEAVLAAAPVRSAAPADERAATTLDLAMLEQITSLEEQTGTGLLTELVRDFCRVAPDLATRLTSAAARANKQDLRDSAHRLRGLAGQLGCRDLAALAAEVEELTIGGDLAAARHHVTAIPSRVAGSVSALRAYIAAWR